MSDPIFTEIIELQLSSEKALNDLKTFTKSVTAEVTSMVKGSKDQVTALTIGLADAYAVLANRLRQETLNELVSLIDVRTQQDNNLKAVIAGDKERTAVRRAMYADEQRMAQENQTYERRILEDNLRANIAADKEKAAVRRAMYADEQRHKNSIIPPGSNNAGGKFNPSARNVLRGGAALAGTFGNFQLAAGIYGLERTTELAGVAEQSILKLSSTWYILGGAMAAVAAGVAVAFKGNPLDKAVAELSALLPQINNTKGKLDELAESAVSISAKFNVNVMDVIKGFKESLVAGVPVEELVAFTNKTGELSRTLGVSFKESSNILTSFKDQYKLSVDDLGHVNDVLFNTFRNGKINVEEFVNGIERLIPVSKAAGISFEEIGAAVATLTREGIPTNLAINGLMTTIEKVIKPSSQAQKEFKALGIEFGEAAFRGKSLIDFINEVQAKTGGGLDALSALFPARQSQRIVSTLTNARDVFGEINSKIDQGGTNQQAFNQSMNTFGQNIGKITEAFSGGLDLAGRDTLHRLNEIFFGDGPISESTLAGVTNAVRTLASAFGAVATTLANIASIPITVFQAATDWLEEGNETGSYAKGPLSPDILARRKHMVKPVPKYVDSGSSLTTPWGNKGGSESDEAVESKYEAHLAKIQEKLIATNASPKQKDRLKELKEELEELDLKAEHTKEQLSKVVAGSEEMVDYKRKAANFEIPQYGVGKTPQQLVTDEFNRSVNTKYEATGLDEQIKTKRDELTELKKQITDQGDYGNFKDTMKIAESSTKEYIKEEVKKNAELKRLDKELADHALAEYEKEVTAYERIQDRKLKAAQRITNEIERAEERHQKRMEDIQDQLNTTILSKEKDPRRQKNIADNQLQSAQSAIQSYVDSGNVNEKDFTAFMRTFDQASKAKQSAIEADTRDSRRAGNSRESDLMLEKSFENAFNATFKKIGLDELDSSNRKLTANRPSVGDAVKKSLNDENTKRTIEERVIKSKVELSITGNIPQETIEKITKSVKDALDRDKTNQTDTPKFAPESFSTSVREPGEE